MKVTYKIELTSEELIEIRMALSERVFYCERYLGCDSRFLQSAKAVCDKMYALCPSIKE